MKPPEHALEGLQFSVTVGPVHDDGAVTLSLKFTNHEVAAAIQRLFAQQTAVTEGDAVRGPRKSARPLPPGMTAWVSAQDVARAMSCSRSKAQEYLRAAAGRRMGTGHLLRVPVDVWEAWARANLNDTPGRQPPGRASRSSPPTNVRRRNLGPWPPATSKLPLIPLLTTAKR